MSNDGLKVFNALYLCAGIGGGALGFQSSSREYRGLKGKIDTICGIDVDPDACKDFEMLTGAPAVQMDLFSRDQYIAFHGKEPSEHWREVLPIDIRNACRGIKPDVVFISAPCKGLSALLPEESAQSPKYQALNQLTLRCIFLVLSAFSDDLPSAILFENVPRITTRGKKLLSEIKDMLRSHGYLLTESFHDCGELGELSQTRKRYLLISRLAEKTSTFIYEPNKYPLKSIGEAIGPLPMPNDPIAGPMHRLPNIQPKTALRLALIEAGKDWRSLAHVNIDELRLVHNPRAGVYQVAKWDSPCNTIIGSAKVHGSNGVAAVADTRISNTPTHSEKYQLISDMNDASVCKKNRHTSHFRVISWSQPSNTVTGASHVANGLISVEDIRFNCEMRSGTFGVTAWDQTAPTVIGSADIHSSASSVADIRIEDLLKKKNKSAYPIIIISADGTWHRPLTTLELAVLQGFPTTFPDGSPLVLCGNNDTKWRERIGNAVPPPSAKAIGDCILDCLLPSVFKEFTLGFNPIWVMPEVTEIVESISISLN